MQFVMRELTHRSKNLLAVVQALARRTAACSQDLQAFHHDFGQRLQALAEYHDLLVARNWEGAPIDDLARSQLALLGATDADRIVIDGASMMLIPEATADAVRLLEPRDQRGQIRCARNAYGKVRVAGRLGKTRSQRQRLVLRWRESGAPAASSLPARDLVT